MDWWQLYWMDLYFFLTYSKYSKLEYFTSGLLTEIQKVNHLTKVKEVVISLLHSHLDLLFNTLDLVLTIPLIVNRTQDKPDISKESCSACSERMLGCL